MVPLDGDSSLGSVTVGFKEYTIDSERKCALYIGLLNKKAGLVHTCVFYLCLIKTTVKREKLSLCTSTSVPWG